MPITVLGGPPPRPDNFISDPTLMSVFRPETLGVTLKSDAGTTVASSTPAFFTTHMGDYGASLVMVGTGYETLLEITGEGFIGNIVSPDAVNSGIRITVDGGQEFAVSNPLPASSRLVFGTSFPHPPATVSGDDEALGMYNNYLDRGFKTPVELGTGYRVPSIDQGLSITTPLWLRNAGLPVLHFRYGIKIEVRGDAADYAGVTYNLI